MLSVVFSVGVWLPGGGMGNRITEIVGAIDGVKEVVLKIEWFDPYP